MFRFRKAFGGLYIGTLRFASNIIITYLRPDGSSHYFRPDGVSSFVRP